MTNHKSVFSLAVIAMTIVSLTTFLGFSIAGISVLIGIIFFIIRNTLEKKDSTKNVLDIKSIITNLKDITIWFLILLPLIMNVVCITLATWFLPEFMEHLSTRTEVVLTFGNIAALVLQLAILAFGEEIAWRGFFQETLSNKIRIIPALVLTSTIFAVGHIADGNLVVVIYDIFFIMINSVIYGYIFYKTNNVWISTISHFIANLFSMVNTQKLRF